MKRLWYRILALLAPGTRVVLALLVLGCLATVFGVLTRLYHLYVWLALSAPTFWTGQIWQVVTYALLPVDVLSFLINGLAIAALGGALERVWSPRELWFYVALVTVAAGVMKIVSQCFVLSILAGPAPLVFGLLVAWGYIFCSERILLAGIGEVTVGLVAVLAGTINLVMIWLSAGLDDAMVVLGGALAGLAYLWFQAKTIKERPARVVHSERMNRLEL